ASKRETARGGAATSGGGGGITTENLSDSPRRHGGHGEDRKGERIQLDFLSSPCPPCLRGAISAGRFHNPTADRPGNPLTDSSPPRRRISRVFGCRQQGSSAR